MLNMLKFLTTEDIHQAVTALFDKHNTVHDASHGVRIATGVNQVANLWREEDGDGEVFKQFCLKYFCADKEELNKMFHRLQDVFEQIDGHFHELCLFLSDPIDVDRQEKLVIDDLLATYDPSAHLSDDFFKSKLAFVVLLNFEIFSLDIMLKEGHNWSRQQWAQARLASAFAERIPASAIIPITQAMVVAKDYINGYDFFMENVLVAGNIMSTKSDRLSCHWGLRDRIKALYAEEGSKERQRTILAIMDRVVHQSIPQCVINNADIVWDPFLDSSEPEPCTRYQHLLNIFKAVKGLDKFYDNGTTCLDRRFDRVREIPEHAVEQLLTSLVSHSTLQDVGEFISNRLGRPLEVFDIWYNQFGESQELSELDAIVAKQYPTLDVLQDSLPVVLMKLGFNRVTAHCIAGKIVLDPGKGSGHATGSERREGKHHMCIRCVKDNGEFRINYSTFDTFMHELGHLVEMYFSTQCMDHNLLRHVPNTGFTEALAFTFQDKTKEVLGIVDIDQNAKHLRVLELFWGLVEMAGVSLIEMRVWHWMYENSEATAEQLRDVTIKIAQNVWNEYFLPVFGIGDQSILAIYSHTICFPLYTSDYFLGSLIQHQIQEHLKDKDLAKEVERMYKIGNVTPDLWMQQAVGVPLSINPIIDSVKKALEALK